MKETVAKLEVLVKLHKVLWALGASSLLDERLAGDRTRRHLSGPSSRIEIESKRQVNGRFDGVCWRRAADVRRVLEANMSSLRGGLRKARVEAAKLEASWMEDLPPETFNQTKKKAHLYLEKYKMDRIKEAKEKEEWVKETMNKCERHYVCKWMREK